MSNHREVRVAMSGVEVGKWLASISSSKWRGPGNTIAPGVFVITAHAVVVRYLDDELGLPTMDPDTEVELMITQRAFDGPEPESAGALAAAALEIVSAATAGLPGRVDNLRIEVVA